MLAALVVASLLAGCDGNGPTPIFREAGPEWGITFSSGVTPNGNYPIPEIVGSGVAVFDANGDGLADIYLIDAGSGRDRGAPNRFYRGRPGGGFEDATEESGLGDTGYGTGVAVGDMDNDGDLDVYVTNWGIDSLYRNDGGTFALVADSGISDDRWSTAAAFVDIDLDGHLDLYVARHADPDVFASGEPAVDLVDYNGPGVYAHEDDSLYRNRGDGTFEDITEPAGLAGHPAASFGILVEDIDDDGWPDVFVANDGVRNHLWMNQRDGTFREEGVQRGVAFNGSGSSEASMGAAMGDIDGDGRRDLFLTHLGGETNTVYRGGSRGGWTDVTGRSGAGQPSIARTGWGAELFDIECDGDVDLVVANGSTWRLATAYPGPSPKPWADYAEPNELFLNDGTGKFALASDRAPGFREEAESSRGLAAADLDADGDLDLIVTNIGGVARIYENVSERAGHWLGLRLMDPDLKREAYGATVTVVAGARRWVDVVGPSSSFLTSVDAPLHFGLGEASSVDAVEVVWPGAIRETFDLNGVDRVHVLTRGEGSR